MSPYGEGLFDLRPGPILSKVAQEGFRQGRDGTDAQGTLPQGRPCLLLPPPLPAPVSATEASPGFSLLQAASSASLSPGARLTRTDGPPSHGSLASARCDILPLLCDGDIRL